MQRRTIFKGIAAIISQSVLRGIFPSAAIHAATGKGPAEASPLSLGAGRLVARRVRPSDPLWPNAASWAKLRAAVGGNLLEPRALFAACNTDPNSAPCTEAVKNIRNPFYIGDQPAGTEVSGWLDAWTPAPSVYAVAARHAGDVAAAVNFARQHNLRLVVKGTGHSYLGTSNAPDSLLIWTRGMNTVRLHDGFVGQGCQGRSAPLPAVRSAPPSLPRPGSSW